MADFGIADHLTMKISSNDLGFFEGAHKRSNGLIQLVGFKLRSPSTRCQIGQLFIGESLYQPQWFALQLIAKNNFAVWINFLFLICVSSWQDAAFLLPIHTMQSTDFENEWLTNFLFWSIQWTPVETSQVDPNARNLSDEKIIGFPYWKLRWLFFIENVSFLKSSRRSFVWWRIWVLNHNFILLAVLLAALQERLFAGDWPVSHWQRVHNVDST